MLKDKQLNINKDLHSSEKNRLIMSWNLQYVNKQNQSNQMTIKERMLLLPLGMQFCEKKIIDKHESLFMYDISLVDE